MEENILIVFYSYSGKTRRIAEMIQKQTGGRLSRIYPRQPYPADFDRLLTQVQEEVRSGRKPLLFSSEGNTDKYDVIFIGSPNWCGTIAPPLAAWIDENDLTGKKILPFFSHCGGEDKGMEQIVRNLCSGADVGKSLYVLENGSQDLHDTIKVWLKQNFPKKERK